MLLVIGGYDPGQEYFKILYRFVNLCLNHKNLTNFANYKNMYSLKSKFKIELKRLYSRLILLNIHPDILFQIKFNISAIICRSG